MTALPAVHLRALTLADAEVLELSMIADVGGFNWTGHRDAGWLVARIRDRETLQDDGGILAVTDDAGQLLGDVGWRRRDCGPPPYSWCWNLGIQLIPEHRGRGYGSAAQRAAADYLFATTTCARIEADTEVTNVAEQRALEKAGFVREGQTRSTHFRAGAWHDSVLYAIIRGDR
ncbi:MAG: hypothetical protein QOH99_1270 [Frankiaceae bacterium]|nr:hypothetical protein [Frankiaceae bacterium]